ncbi:MAG: hypothetical protein QOH99_1610, partial [Frankiaceae bacterium]|nr:hypothetical protein [Frankiaceae bacterium]
DSATDTGSPGESGVAPGKGKHKKGK